ncbi:hypothetical protein ACOSP7_026770 [Xanthoceras sorbifolium]
MFVFGSSLVDNGNNNFLENSLARADYLPYGVDFPWGPSGRFTNGKNVIDLLGEKLKLPSLIPTFSDSSTKGTKIVHGVNFASAASGILDDTGSLARTKNYDEDGWNAWDFHSGLMEVNIMAWGRLGDTKEDGARGATQRQTV